MKYNLYSVFDRGLGVFNMPVMWNTELMARRQTTDLFLMEVGKPVLERHRYVRFPDDFDMYHVGEFDDSTGLISAVAPVLVFRFAEFTNPV